MKFGKYKIDEFYLIVIAGFLNIYLCTIYAYFSSANANYRIRERRII